MTVTAERHRTRHAISAIILAVAALSLGDALIKAASLSLPLWQIYILRSALILPALWMLARRRGPVTVKAPLWVALRSILLVLMWLSYYASLPLMPLSLAAATYYTGPLFIVALAALVARRRPSTRSLFAIGCGFVGVLLIIRPDASGFDVGTLLPLFAAVLYAGAMVLTSTRCREDDPFVLALALNVAFIVGGAILGAFAGREGSFILGPWQSVDLQLFGTIAVLAALVLVGSVGAAFAYQQGPPATVAVFDYSYLAFSLFWGGLIFGELPGITALIGVGIVFGAGLLALPAQRIQASPE